MQLIININQSCIFRVVQVIKSLQDPLEVGNNLPARQISYSKEENMTASVLRACNSNNNKCLKSCGKRPHLRQGPRQGVFRY